MKRLSSLLAVLALMAACNGDGDADPGTTAAPEGGPTTSEGGDAAETVTITGVDYAYEGVPASAEVGAELSFTNASENEVHELVLIRIDDDETRPLEELLNISEEEQQEVTEFRGVSIAFPGEDGMVVDGSLMLDQPGRYAIFCFIPTGADPEEFREAIESGEGGEGPPEVEGGPPHVTQGMYAEITVDG